ncbi:MAG: copper resistance protein NlpE N-terminal domain-containing protein [Gammaproteobacteria bacterium]
MKVQATRSLIVALAVLAACDPVPKDDGQVARTDMSAKRSAPGPLSLMEAPATYAGLLPCADCPGIRTTLTLLPDGIALLRSTYLEAEDGQDRSFVELTTWTLTQNGRQLKLEGRQSERSRLFAVQGQEALLMLGREGKPPKSGLDYTLRRASEVDPIEGPLSLRGYYQYRADAGLFEECRTGARFPVAMEADNIALERAYLNAVTEPGKPLFIALEGRLAMRPAMEGEGNEELSIVPDRFGQVLPGGRCEQSAPAVK